MASDTATTPSAFWYAVSRPRNWRGRRFPVAPLSRAGAAPANGWSAPGGHHPVGEAGIPQNAHTTYGSVRCRRRRRARPCVRCAASFRGIGYGGGPSPAGPRPVRPRARAACPVLRAGPRSSTRLPRARPRPPQGVLSRDTRHERPRPRKCAAGTRW